MTMFSKEQIASAQYTIVPPATSNDGILVIDTNGRNYSIPLTTENSDYVTVMEWVAEGNTIQEA